VASQGSATQANGDRIALNRREREIDDELNSAMKPASMITLGHILLTEDPWIFATPVGTAKLEQRRKYRRDFHQPNTSFDVATNPLAATKLRSATDVRVYPMRHDIFVAKTNRGPDHENKAGTPNRDRSARADFRCQRTSACAWRFHEPRGLRNLNRLNYGTEPKSGIENRRGKE
jgi:hypothetical protein